MINAPKTGLDACQLLATAVVGGLLVRAVLSLFDLPIRHTYIDDLVNWLLRFRVQHSVFGGNLVSLLSDARFSIGLIARVGLTDSGYGII